MTVAKHDRDTQLRELTPGARANLDLGHALIRNLSTIDLMITHGEDCG